jgi:asparagine synthase (glutamine-hydrolysing)
MCGIAGILEFERDTRASATALREMCRAITHHGPEDEGFYTDGTVGIDVQNSASSTSPVVRKNSI